MEPIIEDVRALWRDLTNAPHGFTDALTIVESDDHRCSPPGWIGIVSILGTVVVASPRPYIAAVRRVLRNIVLADFDSVDAALPHDDKLGPARLFYGDTMPALEAGVVGPLSIDDERVRRVLTDASPAEIEEAGLDADASDLHLATDPHGGTGAVCGWHAWPHDVAHIGVLTARASRGTGCGRRAAQSAIGSATDRGLLPQWRAAVTNEASIGLARSLGLTEVGWQLSLAP